MRIVATAGHVDHGKSSLVEALTGIHPDRWDEERRRGLTIDLGFAHTVLRSGERTAPISIVDVPGHVRFLHNMLAGIGAVDACLFVVAATEGWKPQSEEHLRILDLLGIRHGVIALSKSDLVDDDTLARRRGEIREHLVDSPLADAPIVPTHLGPGGTDACVDALVDVVMVTPGAADRGRPRLWIDRVFAAKGSGTVVTGTLTGGSLAVDRIVHAGAHDVRIRGIQSHGSAVDAIEPGNRVALNLAGVDHHQLRRGDAVIDAHQWRPTRVFDASLAVLDALGHQVTRRGAYSVHLGSGEFPARLRVLDDDAIRPGERGLVRLRLDSRVSHVPLVVGDRYILREHGRDETVGGGEILDIDPVTPAARARPDGSVERLVADRGWIDAADLTAIIGIEQRPTIGRWVVDSRVVDAAAAALRAKIDDAGGAGLDIAALDERERALLATLADVTVTGGRARAATAAPDPLDTHPFIDLARRGGCAPPAPEGVERRELRELIRRGQLVERDGIVFHPEAIETAARAAADLLTRSPDGFTVSDLRGALGITRKHAVPLAAELDARGITRRRGDLRIAGPRLPG